MSKHIFFFICLMISLLGAGHVSAQSENRAIDSLQKVIKHSSDRDTGKVSALNALGREYILSDRYDDAIEACQQAIHLLGKMDFVKGRMNACNIMATAFYYKADYPKALDNYLSALKDAENLKNFRLQQKINANIGLIYTAQNEYTKALEYYSKAIKILEQNKIDDTKALSSCYTNIGLAHISIANPGIFDKKLSYLKVHFDTALIYFRKALTIDSLRNDVSDIAVSYTNLAASYNGQQKYDLSIYYNEKALRISQQLEDKKGEAIAYLSLGENYMMMEKYPQALRYAMASLGGAKKIGADDIVKECYTQLVTIYADMKDYEKAYRYQKKYQTVNDSIFNIGNSQLMSGAQAKFEVEKKEIEFSAAKRRQQIIIFAILAILALAAAFGVVIYNRYKLISKQKEIIETQKQLVEYKNSEITQSINYALRIQQAILPVDTEIRQHIPQFFVLYRPKDIVSGDFYYFDQLGDTSYIAAVDCTGHGVPGAFMSMIGHDALNNIISSKKISSPGRILDELNKEVRITLKQEENSTSTKDGMDVALCALTKNPDGTVLCNFAGAMRPFWLIRANGEMSMLKGDKQPIGGYYNEEDLSFTDKEVLLQPGDTFYIFSDGYADQFGGPDGKKLTTGRFKTLLQTQVNKNMDEQKVALDFALTSWLGEHEQIDDVLVIGVKA